MRRSRPKIFGLCEPRRGTVCGLGRSTGKIKPSSNPEQLGRSGRNAAVVPETRFSLVSDGAQRGALTEEIGLCGAAEITCKQHERSIHAHVIDAVHRARQRQRKASPARHSYVIIVLEQRLRAWRSRGVRVRQRPCVQSAAARDLHCADQSRGCWG